MDSSPSSKTERSTLVEGTIKKIALGLVSMLAIGSSAAVAPTSAWGSNVGPPATCAREGGQSVELRSAEASPTLQLIAVRVTRVAAIPPPAAAQYIGIVGVDSTGESLDGGSRYLLHFGSNEIPARGTEWSLALYEDRPLP